MLFAFTAFWRTALCMYGFSFIASICGENRLLQTCEFDCWHWRRRRSVKDQQTPLFNLGGILIHCIHFVQLAPLAADLNIPVITHNARTFCGFPKETREQCGILMLTIGSAHGRILIFQHAGNCRRWRREIKYIYVYTQKNKVAPIKISAPLKTRLVNFDRAFVSTLWLLGALLIAYACGAGDTYTARCTLLYALWVWHTFDLSQTT